MRVRELGYATATRRSEDGKMASVARFTCSSCGETLDVNRSGIPPQHLAKRAARQGWDAYAHGRASRTLCPKCGKQPTQIEETVVAVLQEHKEQAEQRAIAAAARKTPEFQTPDKHPAANYPIHDCQVEAAARAMYERSRLPEEPTWEQARETTRGKAMSALRGALEAANRARPLGT